MECYVCPHEFLRRDLISWIAQDRNAVPWTLWLFEELDGLLSPEDNSIPPQGYDQLVKSLSAVVEDPVGSPLTNVLVQEFSPDWKTVLRTSATDEHGRFSLANVQSRKIYCLQLSTPGFDPLRLRVRVDRKRGANLKLKLTIAT
jgi:hypothetical protein